MPARQCTAPLDAAELRVGMYGNMYTNKPGHNGVIKVQLQEF